MALAEAESVVGGDMNHRHRKHQIWNCCGTWSWK